MSSADRAIPKSPLPTWLVTAILFALTFATFWPILQSDFSNWDDADQLATNQFLNPPSFEGLAKRWTGPFMNIYIPMAHTIWYVLAHFAQSDTANAQGAFLSPFPFKLTNVLFHASTSVLVFLVIAKLVRQRWAALIGAALFCLHPLQVESVGWTSGLKDLLFGFFGTACVLAYLGDEKRGYALSPRGYAVAIAMMLCACLSKPTALVLPAILFVIDWKIAKRPLKDSISKLLPFVIAAVFCAIGARYVQPAAYTKWNVSPPERLLIPAHSLAFYLYKLVWPTQLAFDYGVNWEYVQNSRWLKIAWILPAVLAAIAFAIRKRVPLVWIGLTVAIIPLAPVSGIVLFDFSYYSITADHYVYLPMLGIAIVIAALIDRSKPAYVAWFVLPILIVFAILTTRQAHKWMTPRITTMQSLKVNPDSFSSYCILTILELSESGGDPKRIELAETYARKAIALRDDHPRAYNMLANVLDVQGKHEEALIEIDKAIEISEFDAAYHMARAGILGNLKRGEESIESVRRALRLDPDNRIAKQLVEKWDAIQREQRRRGLTSKPSTQPITAPALNTAP